MKIEYNISMKSIKKILIWFLIFLSLIALSLRFSKQFAETFFGVKQIYGISVVSDPTEATIFLDGKEVGKTPFDSKDLDVKEYTVRLEKNRAFWQGKVKLNAGTVVAIIRDIATDSASSAGEILTLDQGKGITIISNPSDAGVEIDGRLFGKTPIAVNVSTGEHTILVSHANYLDRSIKVDLPVNFNLTVSVDLALSEADLATIETPTITQTPEVVVRQTPTGFLRVRDKASLNGSEITRVKPGDILILLEEQSAWDRVRLPDGTEGYVSMSYVEKKNPQ